MEKQSFNKENEVDLFSQLVKVLERKGMHELAERVRSLSKDVFSKEGSISWEEYRTSLRTASQDILSFYKKYPL